MKTLKSIFHLIIIVLMTIVVTFSVAFIVLWLTDDVEKFFCILIFGGVAVAGFLGFFDT